MVLAGVDPMTGSRTSGYVRPRNLHGLRLLAHRWHAFWCDFHFDRTRTDDLMFPNPPGQLHERLGNYHYGRCADLLGVKRPQ